MSTVTDRATRQEIQDSTESVRQLARRCNISPSTVQKWKKRGADERFNKIGRPPLVPDHLRQCMVMFRQNTYLPLDDCLYALRIAYPSLTRSTLHRYFSKCGLNLIGFEGTPPEPDFPEDEVGFLRVSRLGVTLKTVDATHLISYDHASKFAIGSVAGSRAPESGAEFIRQAVAVFGTHFHTVVLSQDFLAEEPDGFLRACRQHGIRHRTVPEPVSRHPVDPPPEAASPRKPGITSDLSIDRAKMDLQRQIDHYNSMCRLKYLGGRTPAERLLELAPALRHRIAS